MFPLFFWDQPAIIILIIIIVFSPNLQSGAKISTEVGLLELTFDSITHLRDQKAGERLCLDVQHALIQLSQRCTHPFR